MTAVLEALTRKFGAAILATETAHGDEVVEVEAARLVEIAGWLKTDPAMAFDSPVFVTCIDRLGFPLPPEQVSKFKFSSSDAADIEPEDVVSADEDEPRFEVLFQLRSSRHRHCLRIRIKRRSDELEVPSLAHLWPAFDWLERETWDMYGVKFTGHPDLRRIYLYEQFVGYPLRKDYPKERRQPLVRREWTDEVTDFREADRGREKREKRSDG